MEDLPDHWYQEYMKALEDAGFVYDEDEKQKNNGYRGVFKQDNTLVLISDEINERVFYVGKQKVTTPPNVRIELRLLED